MDPAPGHMLLVISVSVLTCFHVEMRAGVEGMRSVTATRAREGGGAGVCILNGGERAARMFRDGLTLRRKGREIVAEFDIGGVI